MRRLLKFLFPLLVLKLTDVAGQVIYPPGYINMNTQPGGLVVPVHYASKSIGDREEYVDDE